MKVNAEGLLDLDSIWHKLSQAIESTRPFMGTSPVAMFGHIYGGYESKYYSYLWA